MTRVIDPVAEVLEERDVYPLQKYLYRLFARHVLRVIKKRGAFIHFRTRELAEALKAARNLAVNGFHVKAFLYPTEERLHLVSVYAQKPEDVIVIYMILFKLDVGIMEEIVNKIKQTGTIIVA